MKADQGKVMATTRALSFVVTGAVLGCVGVTAAHAAEPQDVAVGAAVAQVVAELGKPQGMLKQGRVMVFYYDRGLIDFMDGRVAHAGLLSRDEVEAIKQERQRAEEESRRRSEEEQIRMEEAGRAELESALNDPAFAKRTPTERLAYWQDFGRRYPDINVSNLVAETQAEVERERRRQDRLYELAALTKRVSEIQERFRQMDTNPDQVLVTMTREQVDAERAALSQELDAAAARLRELAGPSATNAVPQAASGSAP